MFLLAVWVCILEVGRYKVKMAKKIYNIEGMHCASCATLVELELEEKGINCSCSFTKQTLEIEQDIDKDTELKSVVEKLGYKLTSNI